MKTIKCDRCGSSIPYIPPYMNAVKNGCCYTTNMMVAVWDSMSQQVQQVDLCDKCSKAVYDFIFQCNNGESNKKK